WIGIDLGPLDPIVRAGRKYDLEAVRAAEQFPLRDHVDAAAINAAREIRSAKPDIVSVTIFHVVGLVDVEKRRDEVDAGRRLRPALESNGALDVLGVQ